VVSICLTKIGKVIEQTIDIKVKPIGNYKSASLKNEIYCEK